MQCKMANKIGEISIDLQKIVLEGWHNYDFLNVLVLGEARGLGHVLPKVDVVKEGEIYRLLLGEPDYFVKDVNHYGGHSRAVLAFMMGDNLECNLYDEHRCDLSFAYWIHYRPISELKPVYRIAWDRLENNLSFLPEEVRLRFAEENDLRYLDNETLMIRDDYEDFPFL